MGGDSARGLISRGIHRKIVLGVHSEDTGTQMLSVRVMRKTKGKRLLRHRMARVRMVEEPRPRLRSERPVSNGRLEKWKGTFRRFQQGWSEILHQLLLEYGDEFKCVPGPKSLHKIALRNNTVCQHFHLITSDITIVCITISLASCDSSPSCHRARCHYR